MTNHQAVGASLDGNVSALDASLDGGGRARAQRCYWRAGRGYLQGASTGGVLVLESVRE